MAACALPIAGRILWAVAAQKIRHLEICGKKTDFTLATGASKPQITKAYVPPTPCGQCASASKPMSRRIKVAAIFGALAIYALSIGPAALYGQIRHPGSLPHRPTIFFYAPILWVTDQWKPLDDALIWYVNLWLKLGPSTASVPS